jgi:hypothetical protein
MVILGKIQNEIKTSLSIANYGVQNEKQSYDISFTNNERFEDNGTFLIVSNVL